MHNIISLRVTEAFMISPKVKHFILKGEATPPLHWIPGQFITIHFDYEGKKLKRSYSLANASDGSNRMEFAAGFVESGPGTTYLFNKKSGDILEATGPFGRLVLKDELPTRYILVATSTGITPYRAMLPALKKHLLENPVFKVVILQGVQYRTDLLYEQEFKQLVAAFPQQVSYIPCLSRETNSDALCGTHSGYVQGMFPDLQLEPAKDLVYLCGNPGMIDVSFRYLQEQGFAIQHIIREKYISR